MALRAWARWLRRCRDLGVSAPDPSLLVRRLTSMTKLVLERDQEVSFRTSLVRSNLLVDTKPSYDSVEQYYHHLLAECEAMAVSSQTSSTTSSGAPTTNKPEQRIKPMKPEPKSSPSQPPQPGSRTTTTSSELMRKGTSADKCRAATLESHTRDALEERSVRSCIPGRAMRRRRPSAATCVVVSTWLRNVRQRSRAPPPQRPLLPLRELRKRPPVRQHRQHQRRPLHRTRLVRIDERPQVQEVSFVIYNNRE